MQNVNELLTAANNALQKFSYYRRVETIDQGKRYIKLRLYITRSLFVQINRNEAAGLTNMVLLLDSERLYGRDEYKGKWHRHPVEHPDYHNHSTEGSKEFTLEDFLTEVDHILKENKLV
jgi:hypothetical protein